MTSLYLQSGTFDNHSLNHNQCNIDFFFIQRNVFHFEVVFLFKKKMEGMISMLSEYETRGPPDFSYTVCVQLSEV